ncbi:MAG: sugar transferase [Fluviicola sp.]|jgi:exopolysaccharide biosynthesis polyprenyl glycosylphosphotransferase|nr:sugar transferase [Fluviicola sp.]
MNKRIIAFFLIVIDWLSAMTSWGLFYYFRKTAIENVVFRVNESFYLGLILVPILWIFLYYLQGTYHDVRRLYRMKISGLSFISAILGTMILFFLLLLDDDISSYKAYYKLLFLLFTIHLTISFITRMFYVSFIVNRIQSNKDGFRTLLIGGSEKAVSIYNEIINLPKGIGNQFVGFVNLNGIDRLLENQLKYLGHADNLEKVLAENQIEEVIIALESTEHERLRALISRIEGSNVKIKIAPDMYDILSGSVKMNNIFGALLFEISSDDMPIWQQIIKRILDILFSVVAIILLIPLYIFLAISVKFSSPGPILFLQERIGEKGAPFKIIKFRTMYVDAEKLGPQLSSTHDPRITKIGRFMRKLRFDEFPQFFNVLFGDMSLVGPRPERQFYIDQIVKIEPQFLQLTKVRPGITSWGQVKFGYAENVDEMLQRMKFDLLYLKNRTLALDFKIMLYTILIILKAKGK